MNDLGGFAPPPTIWSANPTRKCAMLVLPGAKMDIGHLPGGVLTQIPQLL